MKRAVVSMVAMLAATAAFAQDDVHQNQSSYYWGAQVGYVLHYGFDNPGKSVSGFEYHFATYAPYQGDFGARLSVGHQFSDCFGIEIGQGTYGEQYVAYGEADTGVRVTGKSPAAKVYPKLGFDLSLTGRLSMDDHFTLLAKLGAARLDVEADLYLGSDGGDEEIFNGAHYDMWHTVLRGELGLEYRINSNMAVFLSYAHYYGVSSSARVTDPDTSSMRKIFSTMDPNFGMFSFGFTHRF